MADTKITCKDCFKITCKNCDWVASEEEVLQIQKRLMTACPKCGWKPGD